MKRSLLVLSAVLALAAPLSAQVEGLDAFENLLKDFSSQLAPSLPLAASVGAAWSDAYIGPLFPALPPHFGVGVSAGAALLPTATLQPLFDRFGASLPAELTQYGLPLPALAVDARVGGLLLPFDVGLKVGFIPEAAQSFIPAGVDVDYLLFGADIRYALLQDEGLLPDLSVGLGYSSLRGSVGLDFGSGATITDVPYWDGSTIQQNGTLIISDPRLSLDWQANIIDLKVQVSKSLLIFTPYGGLAAASAISQAGGGLSNTLVLEDGLGVPVADPVFAIQEAARQAGQPVPDISATGLSSRHEVNGLAFRAFGGTSIDLTILRVDAQVQYDLVGKTFGFQTGLRLQL